MHALGWTRQQAIDYMLAHTAEEPAGVASEIDRYIIWPGQATSYMMGMIEIRRLRDEAQQKLGPTFDIKAFHDRILEDGARAADVPRLEDQGVDRRFLIASQPSSRRLISFSKPRSVGW